MALTGKNHFGITDMYVDLIAYMQNSGISFNVEITAVGGEVSFPDGEPNDILNHSISPDKLFTMDCAEVGYLEIKISHDGEHSGESDVANNFIHLPQYIGLLGHNLSGSEGDNSEIIEIQWYTGASDVQVYPHSNNDLGADVGQFNGNTYLGLGETVFYPDVDGFSMFPTYPFLKKEGGVIKISNSSGENIGSKKIKLGGIFIGCLFQLGHPDLRMAYNLDTSGVDEFEGIGGHRSTNARWTNSPLWGGFHVPFSKEMPDAMGGKGYK